MAEPATDPSGRDARLVSRLRRARRGSLQPEAWLFAVGGALVAAGITLVIIGWVGTSRTVLVAGQIPYVVSGGLLGLALVFLGGFLYFGYWLATATRQTREEQTRAREDSARLDAGLQAISRSLEDLAAVLAQGQPRPRRAAAATSGAPVRRADLRVATRAGTMIHRPDCPIVANRDDLRDVTASAEGLKRCGICNP